VYDAEGQRVRRVVGGVETWQVYGLGGELIAEYAPGASQSSPQKEYGYRGGERLIVTDTNPNTGFTTVEWVITDHLGSTRAVVNQTGLLSGVTRHDYLPFGEEIQAGVGGRTQSQGYSQPDGTRQRFVGSEHDDETGLDFMKARYYSSTMGRFTSVDPLMASAHVANPQTWNRYTYALNNPLAYIDPDGLKPFFKDYKDLTEDERRILENSKITVGKGKNAQTLSGQQLYDHLNSTLSIYAA